MTLLVTGATGFVMSVLGMNVIADGLERVDPHALYSIERQAGDAVGHVVHVARRGHPVHRAVYGRGTH